ncbi:phage tail fiber protein [Enterobacter hormaechei]|uniref:phage tail fiber domain-containing protein n=1 Tax=Enterobacter hormaechei TaxID=158836 RepID=UPI002E28E66C|nr:phage tail fiber protein [Enterobacter hormaechei]MED5742454.1 phage tail fiber protein [Enterobacter hormaechei]
MSVPNQTPYIIYNANGLTTVFPYEFYIINSGDIQVSINGTTVTSGYSVSGTGNVGGGDVTFITPPASGSVVMLERVVPTYRLTDYQDNGDLLADTVNKDFDRLWMAIQRSFIYLGLALRRPLLGGPYNAEGYRIANVDAPVNQNDAANKQYVDMALTGGLNRVLRTPENIPPLPAAQYRNGKLLGFNNIGNPVLVTPESGSAADVLLQLAASNGALLVGGAEQNYSTVAAMTADTKLKEGDRVRWLGYYAAGDGGGNSGVVVSGPQTADGGKYFFLNNGLFVSAYILTAIDPLQFGLSVNNTAEQNTAAINAAANFCGTYKIPMIHKRGGTYKIAPITLNGTDWDWFWWECPRGLVTLDCDHESLPALVVRGTQTSNTEANFMNSFQYCNIIGFRIRSPYICLRFLYTERCLFKDLVLSGKARASDGVNSSIGFYGPNDLRETSSLDTIADCVVANCNQAFKSGVNTQAELGTKNIVLGDFTIRNTLFTDCGYIAGTYVADFGYIDGATFDTLQISMIGAVAYTTRVHAMRCYKPQLLNMTNCNIWESNGIGLHLLSPRNTCIDASNTIWGSGAGAGAADSDPAILITTYDNVPSTDVQLNPIVGESWGTVVKIVGQNGIDLSGLKEHNNCKYQTTPGIHLQNCAGTRMFNAQMASSGTHIARVDNADFEIQNLKYSGYTAQFDNLNNGTVSVVPGLRVRQVTSATIAGGLDDEIQYNAASGSAIVTLPAANRFPGKLIRIIKTDASANGVGVFPASGSGQTINGSASYSLTSQFSFVHLRSDGSNWIIVGKS